MDAKALGKELTLPHDVVNEQILIAAAISHAPTCAALVKRLTSDLFVQDEHAAIWTEVQKLVQRGLVVDVSSLSIACQGRVEPSYIAQLRDSFAGVPANLDHHIESLRWDKRRVSAARGPMAELLKLMRDPSSPPGKLRTSSKQLAQMFEQSGGTGYLKDSDTLVRGMADAVLSRSTQGVWEFGIEGLDVDLVTGKHRLIPGAAPGKTTLITGVSGSGKSAVCARIMLEQARLQRPCLYGPWEMGAEPTLELMAQMSLADEACARGEVDHPWTRYNFGTGQLTRAQNQQFRERAAAIAEVVKFFDAPFQSELKKRYDNDDALDLLSQQIADSGAEVVALDLWERAIPNGEPSAERRALFRQQQIAKETNTHCILVCQQRLKEVESRDDKRPARDTILGSSAWVDIADTILGVHRPALWKPTLGDTKMEILVLKQRFGRWPIYVEFEWDGESVRLENARQLEIVGSGQGALEPGIDAYLSSQMRPVAKRKAKKR